VKFACPKCTTRYSIADEKVPAGATLRFPCKKCGTVIRLRRKGAEVSKERGEEAPTPRAERPAPASLDAASTRVANINQLARLRKEAAQAFGSEAEQTRVSSKGELDKLLAKERRVVEPEPASSSDNDGEWFALVAGVQKGPVTHAELVGMLARKAIDKRTYVWRDGMGDWQRLGTVDQFKAETSGADSAAWRVMEPTAPATPPAANFNESTVAMNAQQLQAQLARTRAPRGAAAAHADQTPVNTEEAPDSVERLSSDVSAPELLDALAGVPPGERLPREALDEGSGLNTVSAVLLPQSLTPVTAGDEDATGGAAARSQEFRAGDFPAATEEPMPASDTGPVPFAASTTSGDADSGEFFSDLPDVNQAYVNAPPGESTRVFMATAGIYKRRRTHRIAATIGILLSVALVGTVSLDIVGVIQIPGMGMVYDVTGLIDPNKDRAVKRVDDKLSDGALDSSKRSELEAMRRRLLGLSTSTATRSRSVGPHAGGGEHVGAGEGIKESGNMSEEQKSLASSVFNEGSKRETKVNLAEATEVAAPNLPSGLTQEAIFKVIMENSRSMNLCLTESMKKGEKLSGKMEIILTIAPDGSVPEARIDAPEFKSTQMAACTIRRIRSWKFPRFNGDPVTVSYPYVLQMGF